MSELQVEKKVYNGWAFKEHEAEKGTMNREIYNELISNYKVYRSDIRQTPEVNTEEYDVIIGRKAGYLHSEYSIIKNGPDLSTNELLLLCDQGNLCFGGSIISSCQLRVSED